ncbi:type II toxin-antitoxin system YafO family toxin [Klebsiella variicola]|uniref:type II toxin-antitoxin system YafO family toxin n=1 Tax=Klebsiella variicola TaxID=244366 RepID=UPI0021675756|nr:type II toxin-antitoxin system YafO family toxin [Klebsiella variicola]UVW54678.1 type II toxin-antitoxin system YafO family toxin [Klebsiella variicola]
MGFKISRSQALADVITQYPITAFPIEEFEAYKRECIDYDDTPAPAIHVQLKHPAHIETIGRDKLMERPVEARSEELHHAHIWQEGCCWEDDDGLLVQWASTSDSYVVYSYFRDRDDDHHFFVIDFCRDEAHAIIEDATQVAEWTRQAKEFRQQNI